MHGKINYSIDEFDTARKFVRGLPSKLRKERFDAPSNLKEWTPDHLVLVKMGGKVCCARRLLN